MYVIDGEMVQQLNFLDIIVILKSNGRIETDVFYKETNLHEYLNFNSHYASKTNNCFLL